MWESRSSPLFTKARQLCCRAFFVKSGDDPDAKQAASHPNPCLGALPLLYLRIWRANPQVSAFSRYYLCLGALPLLYPAAPPSVFDYCIVKYTAPAVALEREYVVRFMVVMFVFSLMRNFLFLMPVKFTKRYQQYFSYLCSGIKKFDYQGKAR